MSTIFLTTHYIEEAERLCDRIAFIMSGRIVRVDTVANLVQPIREKHVMQITCANGVNNFSNRLAEEFPGQNFTSPEPGVIQVEADSPIRVGPLVRFLEDSGAEVAEARRIRPSLEDVFVQITGVGADVMRKEKEKLGGNK
ncbi:hypothetical protein [Desulfobacter sp. UBA2225]|uniref:hypothetical protein n=1 Tax=Desulfobacter sp. UBA2225 TaxID=1961413 RepID=UPI0025801CD5|nr:hypothetical protein [Desulfobacter sp. UBA2225]